MSPSGGSRGSLAPGGSALGCPTFGSSTLGCPALGCPTFSRSAFGCGSSPSGCDGDGTDGDCVRCRVNGQQAIQRTLAVHPQHLTPDTGVVGILGIGRGCPACNGGINQRVAPVAQHPAPLVTGAFDISPKGGLYIQGQHAGGHFSNQATGGSVSGKLVICITIFLGNGNAGAIRIANLNHMPMVRQFCNQPAVIFRLYPFVGGDGSGGDLDVGRAFCRITLPNISNQTAIFIDGSAQSGSGGIA